MKSRTIYRLTLSLILTVGHLPPVSAVTDAELEALEKQIDQQELEEKQKTETELEKQQLLKEKRRLEKQVEELRKQEVEAKKQAEEKRKQEAEEKRFAEEETKRQEEERIAEMNRKRKQELTLAGEMVDIPGGTFEMGSNEDDRAHPIHTVTITPFKMGKYEVTFAQWDACVTDGGCNSYSPDDRGWGRDNQPVISVKWDEVQGYIKWLNQKTEGRYRLPSEAEWEYACRSGGQNQEYCGGNSHDNVAWHKDNSGEKAHMVGQKHPNGLGLYDMSGNVGEWLEDCWHENYSGAPSDGRAWSTGGKCNWRVYRGGSWNFKPQNALSAYRSWSHSNFRQIIFGFRLAQDRLAQDM